MAHVSNSPYPVIVCGDFNDIPQSYAYHSIRQSLKHGSSIRRIRNRVLRMQAASPGLRIDDIFTDPQFTPIYCQRGKVHVL